MVTRAEVIKVEEVQSDILVDGLLQKYDESATHKIGLVTGGNKDLLEQLRKYVPYGKIYVTYNNFNKSPYFGMCYIVEMKYIIDVMSEEDYLKTFKPVQS